MSAAELAGSRPLGAAVEPYHARLTRIAWHRRCVTESKPLAWGLMRAGTLRPGADGTGEEKLALIDRVEDMTERLELPVLPLRETVVFPGVTAPIVAGRDKTLRAIEKALENEDEARQIFAVAQRENADEPTTDVLYNIGVICRIAQVQRFPTLFFL